MTPINEIVTTIGIDVGKNIFHIVGMNARGAIIMRERLSRTRLHRRLANIAPCLIGMELVSEPITLDDNSLALVATSARFQQICEAFPQRAHDYHDAEAIAEAVRGPL